MIGTFILGFFTGFVIGAVITVIVIDSNVRR